MSITQKWLECDSTTPFGPAARARGVEKHRRVCRLRRNRSKGAVVEQRGEILLEDKARQIGRAKRQARSVA